jgi:hypothetical protein
MRHDTGGQSSFPLVLAGLILSRPRAGDAAVVARNGLDPGEAGGGRAKVEPLALQGFDGGRLCRDDGSEALALPQGVAALIATRRSPPPTK